MPATSGVVEGIDLSVLDPAEEDDRHFLLLAEHPEMAQAMTDGRYEIEFAGVSMSAHPPGEPGRSQHDRESGRGAEDVVPVSTVATSRSSRDRNSTLSKAATSRC